MYSYVNTKRPNRTTNADGTVSCECGDPELSTLCSFAQADSDEYAYCIPTDSMCPVRHVEYRNGQLWAPSDSSVMGQPVIDFKLSEGGPPCALYNEYRNVQPNKESYRLMPGEYYETCPKFTLGAHEFDVSYLFKRVVGFNQTDELALLQDND